MPKTYHNLRYHVVFSAKNRIPAITVERQDPLYRYIGGIARAEGAQLLEIGGVADHVHLLVGAPPRIAVSELVKAIKGGSSRWLNQTFRDDPPFAWQEGYAAFSVSESQIERIRAYIRRQPEHHRESSFNNELAGLLSRHRVAFSRDDLEADNSGRPVRGEGG